MSRGKKDNATIGRKVESKIIKYLREVGYFVKKIENAAIYDNHVKAFRKFNKHRLKGHPDVILVRADQKIVYIEIKSGNATLKKNQKEFRNLCMAQDFEYIILHSIIDTKDYFNEDYYDEMISINPYYFWNNKIYYENLDKIESKEKNLEPYK